MLLVIHKIHYKSVENVFSVSKSGVDPPESQLEIVKAIKKKTEFGYCRYKIIKETGNNKVTETEDKRIEEEKI